MADHDPASEIDTLRARIRGETVRSEDCDELDEGDVRDLDDEDRERLLEMSDNILLVPSEIGDHRHLKLLRHNARMAEHAGPLHKVLEDEAAAKRVVRWIHRQYENEHTNQDYRTALRSFGRYTLNRDEPPETLAWIPTGTSNDFDPVPSERDLLTYDEVQRMAETTRNTRDAALIMLQFEAGCRSGELYDLRRRDIFDGEHSIGIHVDGKQGERAVHLIVATPYLQQWLRDHPSDDPDAWLWSKLDTPDRPSYNTWLTYFRQAAKRADVAKTVTPTAFRKSNTRWLLNRGMNTARIEDRQGRKRGSKHTARYAAHFGEESNERVYAAMHGEEVKPEDTGEVTPLECPRCSRETPREKSHCVWCNQALSQQAVEALDTTVDAGVDELTEADESDAQAMFAAFLKFARDNPHLVPEDAHELISSSSSD
jgi:integrase